ncbi:hypothetical protein BHE74_00022277 [Ensete ventricosum]|nr:hypothetical protein GW17_00025857 [Ensete ventricosum]RWW70087.1 hypothetical protein BHE74_00022277 [Ensete ventricosum]RZR85103.1 hypothetical protein BHM03_00012053 [Ensete ventricosum]
MVGSNVFLLVVLKEFNLLKTGPNVSPPAASVALCECCKCQECNAHPKRTVSTVSYMRRMSEGKPELSTSLDSSIWRLRRQKNQAQKVDDMIAITATEASTTATVNSLWSWRQERGGQRKSLVSKGGKGGQPPRRPFGVGFGERYEQKEAKDPTTRKRKRCRRPPHVTSSARGLRRKSGR